MKKNILLLALTSFFVLAIAETALRFLGIYTTYPEKTGTGGYVSPYTSAQPSWYHVYLPHEHLERNGNEFTISWNANNEGLKDVDFTVPKKKIRLMVLGDSFVEGVGASNDSSLPKQLSYLLADSFEQPTEVWNCGISGSDAVYEYRLFKDKLLKYRPDMAVVVINKSDIYDAVIRGGFERFNRDGTVKNNAGPWFEPLYAHCYLVRLIVHNLFKYNWEFIPPSRLQKTEQAACDNLIAAIDSFDRAGKENNIRLLIVFHPITMKPEKGFDGKPVRVPLYHVEPLIRHCENKMIPFVEAGEQFSKMGIDSADFERLLWKQDRHFKNRGYYYFAKSIWKKVTEQLNLDL